jgi:hypothetical protein
MDLAPLWLAVERGFPVYGVREALDQRLGSALTASLIDARVLIAGRIADRYPCPNTGGTDCPRQVMKRRLSDGFRAICTNKPAMCQDLLLREEQVRLWQMAEDRLLGLVAEALGMHGRLPSRLPTIDAAWLMGSVPATSSTAVFLPLGDDRRIAAAITQVRDQFGGMLQVWVPRSDAIGAQARQAARRDAVIHGLDRAFAGFERGRFLALPATPSQVLPVVPANDEQEEYAVAWINGERQILSRPACEDLRRRSHEFTVFADRFTGMTEKQIGPNQRQSGRLTPSMFAVLRVILEAGGKPVDVTTEEIPGLDAAAQQVFRNARRTIDIRKGKSWSLFKNHAVDRRAEYLFAPDRGVTSCFIYPANTGVSAA